MKVLSLKQMIKKGRLSSNAEKEMYGCFLFFWKEAQTAPDKAYGLIRDNQLNKRLASIASVGFGLAALPIAVEKGWVTKEDAYERALGTQQTLLTLENIHGFFFHFIKMDSGRSKHGTELSVIDTAIVICGSIVAASYFGGEVAELNDQLFTRIDWNFYIHNEREQFYMGYWRDRGFSGYWDNYAEQLMLYVLGASSPTHKIPGSVYYKFDRLKGGYKDYIFIHTWHGSLFAHQFSHAFIDLREKVDGDGIDWFNNSTLATKAQYEYCLDNRDTYKSFSENSWGVTACDTEKGYRALGIPPSGRNNTTHDFDGTVATSAALGSCVFTPDKSLRALDHYMTIEGLSGEYGLKNSFNADIGWVSRKYIGIDKGITLLMLANLENEIIWKLFMKFDYVILGLKELGFVNTQDEAEKKAT